MHIQKAMITSQLIVIKNDNTVIATKHNTCCEKNISKRQFFRLFFLGKFVNINNIYHYIDKFSHENKICDYIANYILRSDFLKISLAVF
jgi:hypothetical protein